VGGSFKPGSDIIQNTGGATFREMNVYTDNAGGFRALWFRSGNRTSVEADVKWKLIRAHTFPSDGGDPHVVPGDIMAEINKSEWFRARHLSGAPITTIEAY
jgi:hypothetical protein